MENESYDIAYGALHSGAFDWLFDDAENVYSIKDIKMSLKRTIWCRFLRDFAPYQKGDIKEFRINQDLRELIGKGVIEETEQPDESR